MHLVSKKNKSKRFGIKKQINSFSYCFAGIIYTLKNEQSFIIQVIIGTLAIILGFIFKLSTVEWIIVILLIGLVLAFELINTAVERTVDMMMQDIHPLAKIAKDTAAASVFIVSLSALIIGIIIYLPKIITLL